MLPRQHAPQQIGACVAHATESCIPDGGHACGVQEHNDEIEFVALDFMHRGAEPRAGSGSTQAPSDLDRAIG